MAWSFLLSLSLASSTAVPDLLVCRGSTVGEVPTGRSSAVVSDRYGNRAVGSSVDTEVRQIDGVVQLRLNGDDPRANMPRIFAPEISSSQGGWYRIKSLQITDDQITGKVVFNFLNSSKFAIDRRTGVLTSEGGFQAMCEEADTTQRKF
jgi:hypothetical protein